MAADPTSADAGPEAIGYADAVAELEEILAQLDGDDVDVDHLATQVRRAAELIALCRERLAAARMEVTRIVADLDGLGDGQGDALPSEDDEAEAPGEGLFVTDGPEGEDP